MYLDEEFIKEMMDTLKTAVPAPVSIADENGRLIGLTDESLRSQSKQLLLDAANGITPETKANQSTLISELRLGQKFHFYVLIFSDNLPENCVPYTLTLVKTLILDRELNRQEEEQEKRRLLTSRLANFENVDYETESYLRNLNLLHTAKRCAVLFFLNIRADEYEGRDISEIWKRFGSWLGKSGAVTEQDIYGALNNNQFLIFKAADNEHCIPEMLTALRKKTSEWFSSDIRLLACVGSFYEKTEKLRESYMEAAYLYDNFEYLNTEKANELYIKDHIFEYLYSCMGVWPQENLLKDWERMLDTMPLIQETCIALSRNNSSPARAGAALSIHRNTILQRTQKLTRVTGLDPIRKTQDRAILRAYALKKEQKTVWNAGTILQPGSVLYRGMTHLAGLVYRKSGGTFQINLHTISNSGDNRQLFNMLNKGTLDAVACSTIAMEEYTGGQISVLSLPFLFDSIQEAKFILNKIVVFELKDILYRTGIICPCFWTMGWRYLSSKNTPIRIPEDVSGRKIRILACRMNEDFFAGMGAVPLKIYYSDIRESLRSDIIECQENPYMNILDMEFYKYQDYVTELPMFLSPEAFCFSRKSWEALDEKKQRVLTNAVEETTDWLYSSQETLNEQAKAELIQKGMHIVVPSEKEVQEWKAYAKPLYENRQFQNLLLKIKEAKKLYEEK